MLILQAVIVRPLSAVTALVRFAEEPQMFAIDFNDGCPMHVRLLSAINFFIVSPESLTEFLHSFLLDLKN